MARANVMAALVMVVAAAFLVASAGNSTTTDYRTLYLFFFSFLDN
jgi:hypothetical protein